MAGFLGKVLGAFSSRKPQDPNDTSSMAVDEAPASKKPVKRLFDDDEDDDDDDDDEEGASAVGAEDAGAAVSFTINEEYARRYEHNKKREEKQKLEEKYGKAGEDNNDDDASESSSSDDGTEDEDGYLLTEDLDARMSAALQAIKNKDPRLYDNDAKFFDAAEAEQAGQAAAAAAAAARDGRQKPIYLQDYHRERYLRGDVGADDDDDSDRDGAAAATAPPKTYQQEQDEIKKALVDSMNAADQESGGDGADDDDDDDDDDEDAFLKPKAATAATKAAAAATGVHPARAGRIQVTKLDVESADKDPHLFLSNFLASRSWAPDAASSGPGWEAFDSEEDDEDAAANTARAEAYETAYNMRFEDPNKSNEVLKSYSRTVAAERSVRRQDKTARQRQRDQERAAKEAAKQARRDERARLRRLHVEEAQEKLALIKQAAGVAGRTLAEDEWMGLLDGAWDNDAWEAEMRKHFGDDYYAAQDAALDVLEAGLPGGGEEEEEEEEKGGGGAGRSKKSRKLPKKPKWDDDIDIRDLVPDFEDDEAPTIALTDDEAEADASGDNNDEQEEEELKEEEEDDDDDDDGEGRASKRRKTGKDRKKDRAEAKRVARRERARIEALVDRQMALDDPAALAAAAAGPATGVNAEGPAPRTTTTTATGFRYRETSPQAFGLTARDILLAPSDAALNEFAGLKKLATFRDAERKRRDRKKLGKKARLRQWRRETFGADFEHTGPTFGFEQFVDEGGAAAAAAGAEAGAPAGHGHKRKHKHKHHHQKEEGRRDAAAAPTKRKRSRKNKDKAKAGE